MHKGNKNIFPSLILSHVFARLPLTPLVLIPNKSVTMIPAYTRIESIDGSLFLVLGIVVGMPFCLLVF